jgi:hypothetical protein
MENGLMDSYLNQEFNLSSCKLYCGVPKREREGREGELPKL